MLSNTETPRVSRWGNSLAVRIPAKLARQIALEEGRRVELAVEGGKLIIEPLGPEPPRYDLDQLLAGISADNLHEEYDLGDPVGSEAF